MKVTLESGIDQTLSIVGYNFMFKNGSGDIRVRLLKNDSTVIEESVLEVGEQLVNGQERFEKINILNLHDESQIVEFEAGSYKRENTREGSSVSVVDVPDIEVAKMPPVVVSSTPENPQKYFSGANQEIHYSVNTAGPVAVVQPYDNVNGLVIYQYYVSVANNNSHQASIILNSSVPMHSVDGCVLAFDYGLETMGVGNGGIAMPLFVKAGQGLYFYGLNHNVQSVIYEVL